MALLRFISTIACFLLAVVILAHCDTGRFGETLGPGDVGNGARL